MPTYRFSQRSEALLADRQISNREAGRDLRKGVRLSPEGAEGVLGKPFTLPQARMSAYTLSPDAQRLYVLSDPSGASPNVVITIYMLSPKQAALAAEVVRAAQPEGPSLDFDSTRDKPWRAADGESAASPAEALEGTDLAPRWDQGLMTPNGVSWPLVPSAFEARFININDEGLVNLEIWFGGVYIGEATADPEEGVRLAGDGTLDEWADVDLQDWLLERDDSEADIAAILDASRSPVEAAVHTG